MADSNIKMTVDIEFKGITRALMDATEEEIETVEKALKIIRKYS